MSDNGNNGHTEGHELITYDRPSGIAAGPRLLPMSHAEDRSMSAEDRSVSQDYISLAACWHLLLKRRWTVLTVIFVLTTLAAIVSFRMKPIYKATARVELEAETPLTQSITDLYQKIDADEAFLQTQIQVLKSDNLAWRTIEQLHLAENSAFARPDKLAKLEAEERKFQLIASFRDDLSVELVPKTRMLAVGFESPDPQTAAQAATSLVNNYLEYNFRKKYDSTRQASGWMEQQLDELKAKVEQSQQALVDYERQHKIANTNDKQNVLEQMLSDLSRNLTTAESERMEKESLYRQVQGDRSRIASLAHDELLQKLEEKSSELQGQYTEIVTQYGPKFPKAMRLQEQINENQSQIEREQNRVMERIRRDYDAAVNRQKLAAAAVVRQKEDVGDLNQLLVQHNILQREFETNQQLYQNLLQRLKNAAVSAGLRSTNIHFVDTALPPTTPVRPRKLLNIAIGLLAGVILGVMGAFAQERLDYSVKTPEEVEALPATTLLAILPLDATVRATKRPLLANVNGNKERYQTDCTVALTVVERPKSELAEAYRSLGTSILMSVGLNPPKTLLITSTQAGEGKTATALNLAQALAQRRRGPVLIVDCDLRNSGVARALGLNNDKGLSTVLAGSCDCDEALQQYSSEPKLWILPSGPIPANPAEFLASDAMDLLFRKLASRFEHVILDSPPVLPVTDATILSRLVDGVVLVVESGTTPRAGLLRTRRILENVGARILGVALNKLDLRHQGYYGSYQYSYYPRHSPS
jgi:polysaccharide biosynthesis transport protein